MFGQTEEGRSLKRSPASIEASSMMHTTAPGPSCRPGPRRAV